MDITKEHYQDRKFVNEFVKKWYGFKGYGHEYRALKKLLPEGAFILDAGCGPGRDVTNLSKKGFRVIGIDRSEAMIKKAKILSPRGKFLVMDLKRKLNFGDDYFDCVWIAGVVVHLTERELSKAIKEFGRVLKTHGLLFIATRKGRSKGVIENGLEGGRFVINYYDKHTLTRVLNRAGFKIFSYELYKDEKGRPFKWMCIYSRLYKRTR